MDAAAQSFRNDRLARGSTASEAWSGRSDARRWLGRWGLCVLFLAYGLVAIPSIAYVTPPFQVSDELSHFQRASMVSLGELVGERRGTLSGGVVSTAIGHVAEIFWPVVLHPERRVTRDMFDRASTVEWGSEKNYETFENTAIYPPQFYLPAALGIKVGRAMGLPVVPTLDLSRILTGLAAVAVGSVAIAVAGTAALWIFALLTLPMSLSSMASVSQEALLLATAALAAGLYVAAVRREAKGLSGFAVLCVALAAIATGRLPYVILAVLPLAVRSVPLRARLIGCGAIVATAATWSAIASRYAYVKYGIGTADAPTQMRYLLGNPGQVPSIVWNTFKVDGSLLIESFVGRLGWLDLWLPRAYHVAAWIVLGAAILCVAGWRSWDRAAPFATAGAVLLSVGAIFGALYLSWSPVGFSYAGGAQGRYFIPLALFVPAVLPPPSSREGTTGRVRALATTAVLLFPIVSVLVTFAGIADRYYEPAARWFF